MQQKRNYGFADVTSVEAFKTLPKEQAQRFNNTVGRLPHTDSAGLKYAAVDDWRTNLGFNFWQVEREISAGDPPKVWARLEGSFDRAAIEQTLTRQDYQAVSYHGQTYLARYDDFAIQSAIRSVGWYWRAITVSTSQTTQSSQRPPPRSSKPALTRRQGKSQPSVAIPTTRRWRRRSGQ